MEGKIQIYYGDGRGKSTAALGHAIPEASAGKNVVIIQFLKGKDALKEEYVKRLEPEIRLFTFEKSECFFKDLSEEEKKEEAINIRNGLNYAHKVLSTGECDVLILDEALGLIDEGIIESKDLINLIDDKPEEMDMILTGFKLTDDLRTHADRVYEIKKN